MECVIHKYGLLYILGSGYTDGMTRYKNIQPFKSNIFCKKIDYSTAVGSYHTSHDVQLQLFIPVFYISRILSYHFHADSNEDELGIGCDMTII